MLTILPLHRSFLRFATLACVCAAGLAPRVAAADTPPPAESQTRTDAGAADAARSFSEAKAAYDAGRYEEACRKFEQSQQAKPGIGTQFNIANCWEKLGRLASTHAMFLSVAEATHALGQTDRETLARERAAALEPRLSRLVIRRKDTTPGVEIRRNGHTVPEAELGTSQPVDPGDYEITAQAPGKKTWSTRVQARPGEAGSLIVEVPELEAAPPPVVPVAAATTRSEPVPAERKPSQFRHAATLALAGVGGLALLAGLGFTAQTIASNQDAEAVCPSSVNCTQSDVDLHETLLDDSRTARTWALVGIGTGVAAFGAAAVLFLTDPAREKHPEHTARLHAEPVISPAEGTFGAAVRGHF